MNKLPLKLLLLLSLFVSLLDASRYTFRKYLHVESFYEAIYRDAIELGVKNNIPPAAMMAIAGLESGYGRGYVAQITGNILSLGAYKSDKELPALYLPYSRSLKKVLFDPKEIAKQSKSDLVWKKRDKSLKRDYRPAPYASTDKNLALLKYNSRLKEKAIKSCINDFTTRWISESSNIKVFRDAKKWLNKLVEKNGKNVLFTQETNEKFIDIIGGHSNSFNYRKTWPKKVKLIMNKAGLVKLSQDLYINKLSFKDAWSLK